MEGASMSQTVLHVRNWNELFENSETRKYKHLKWVPVPNKLDGDGIVELLDHRQGAAHFGIWVILLELASRGTWCRGFLTRSGASGIIPHDPVSISRVTRTTSEAVQAAIARLLQIGWLERLEWTGEKPPEVPPAPPEESPDDSEKPPLNRIEQNRIERGGEQHPAPALTIKKETKAQSRNRFRKFLAKCLLASDETAVDEWIGLMEETGVKGAENVTDCVNYCIDRSEQAGQRARYAPQCVQFARDWKAQNDIKGQTA